MNISIESNARELQKKLSLFQKKHLGKATNDAINKTLFGLRKEMTKQTQKKLDRPTAATQKGFVVFQSKINKLSGKLFIKDFVADYLKYQIDGGVRQGTPNVAVPYTKNVRLNKFGNVPARKTAIFPYYKIAQGYIKSKFDKNLDEKIKKEIARAK